MNEPAHYPFLSSEDLANLADHLAEARDWHQRQHPGARPYEITRLLGDFTRLLAVAGQMRRQLDIDMRCYTDAAQRIKELEEKLHGNEEAYRDLARQFER